MQVNHIEIDDNLIQEAILVTGLEDKKILFLESLKTLIRLKKQEKKVKTNEISALFGLIETPITATLEELEQAIVEGAVVDSH